MYKRQFHEYSGGNGGGSYSVYEIDETSGAVSGHSYDILNENDVLNRRALAPKQMCIRDRYNNDMRGKRYFAPHL